MNSKIVVILKANDNDLAKTLSTACHNSHLTYGSEFRPPVDLEDLLSDHELWIITSILLSHGSTVPLEYMSPVIEAQHSTLGLDHGNHKGALAQQLLLHELVDKDVVHGLRYQSRWTRQN